MLKSHAASKGSPAFAATDMLHRRIPLPYRFQIVLGSSNVLIKTDSPLMKCVLNGSGRSSGLIAEAGTSVWEIAVELRNETVFLLNVEMTDSFDAYFFGPSRSLRMSTGSWFAYTPPSLSGVGFAIVHGDECCQLRQLIAFIEKIKLFVGDFKVESPSQAEREVLA